MAREGKSLGPAVISGELVYTSVSAITTFDPSQFGGCNRRWVFEKIHGIKPPGSKSQDRGTKAHAEIEHYQKEGADVLSPLTRAGKHFLPDHSWFKRGILKIEEPFGDHENLIALRTREIEALALIEKSGNDGAAIEENRHRFDAMEAALASTHALHANGIPLVGYIDNLITSGEWIDNEGTTRNDGPDAAEVGDHKTTKSILSYGKGGHELIDTVQMAGYGELVRLRYPEKDRVRLSHNYFQTEGRPVAEKRSAIFPLEQVSREWDRVEGIVREMQDVARDPLSKTDVKKIPAHLESCTAFRGCPHRAICPKTPETLLFMAVGKGKGMSLLNRNKPAGTPAPTKPEAPAGKSLAPKTAPKPSALPPGIDPAKAKEIEAKKAALEAELAALEAAEGGADGEAVDTVIESAAVNAKDADAGEKYWIPTGASTFREATAVGFVKKTGRFGFLFSDGSAVGLEPEDRIVPVPVTEGGAAPAAERAKGLGVLAPDAPASGSAAKTAEPVPPESIPALDPKVAEAAKAHALAEADKAGKPVERVGEPAPEAPKKPGRPLGSKNKPKDTTPPAPAPQASTEHAQAPEAVEASPTPATGIVLFVDVITTSDTEDLGPYLAKACGDLCTEFEAADVRCAPEKSPLAFGKWKGALSAYIRAEPPPPGRYSLLFTKGDEIKEVAASALRDVIAESGGEFNRGI